MKYHRRALTLLHVILAIQEGNCETITELAKKCGFTGKSGRQEFYNWLSRKGLRLKHGFSVVPKDGFILESPVGDN